MPTLPETPSSQAGSPSQDAPIISGKPDSPVCPTCQRAMAVKLVMPLMSVTGIDETVYACDVCGTETHRATKRR